MSSGGGGGGNQIHSTPRFHNSPSFQSTRQHQPQHPVTTHHLGGDSIYRPNNLTNQLNALESERRRSTSGGRPHYHNGPPPPGVGAIENEGRKPPPPPPPPSSSSLYHTQPHHQNNTPLRGRNEPHHHIPPSSSSSLAYRPYETNHQKDSMHSYRHGLPPAGVGPPGVGPPGARPGPVNEPLRSPNNTPLRPLPGSSPRDTHSAQNGGGLSRRDSQGGSEDLRPNSASPKAFRGNPFVFEWKEYVEAPNQNIEVLRKKLQGSNHEHMNHIEEECQVQLRLRGDNLSQLDDNSLHFFVKAKTEATMVEARGLLQDLIKHCV